MPALWVIPKMSPLGLLRISSAESGRLPAGPGALVWMEKMSCDARLLTRRLKHQSARKATRLYWAHCACQQCLEMRLLLLARDDTDLDLPEPGRLEPLMQLPLGKAGPAVTE